MNDALVKRLRKLVDVEGAAKVSVRLNYRDSRSVLTWVQTGKIPRARVELVRAMFKNLEAV